MEILILFTAFLISYNDEYPVYSLLAVQNSLLVIPIIGTDCDIFYKRRAISPIATAQKRWNKMGSK